MERRACAACVPPRGVAVSFQLFGLAAFIGTLFYFILLNSINDGNLRGDDANNQQSPNN